MSLLKLKVLPMVGLVGCAMLAACQAPSQTQGSADASDLVVVTAASDDNLTYTCETGVEIKVESVNENELVLDYGENPWTLSKQVSGSGSRYSNDEVIWLTQADQGMLYTNDGSGQPGQRLEVCQQDS